MRRYCLFPLDEKDKGDDDMTCPFCNQEMKDGVVQSARKIFFTTKPRNGWMLFEPRGEDTMLSWHNMTRPTCVAYRCRGCKKVIIDYDIEVE